MRLPSRLIPALVAPTFISIAHGAACPPLGPVLPAPQCPGSNRLVEDAAKELVADFSKEFEATLRSSGVSIGVKSIHEDSPLFNYHYTAPMLSGFGTRSIDENTVYRVGGVSKLVSALLALQEDGVDLGASVVKYIPELRDETSASAPEKTTWDDVTVESLMSHLTELAPNTTQDLALLVDGPGEKLRLPQVPKDAGLICMGLFGSGSCTKSEFIESVKRHPPVVDPYATAAYSDVGFALLGMVVESATGKTLDNLAQENILDVVGMRSTSIGGPPGSFGEVGFVPKGETTWNSTLGAYEAAGSMFSNTVDLLAFGEAILANRLLSPAQTRQWMKPREHTSSLGRSFGGPWEILRSDSITSDRQVVDVYNKGGDVGLYHAMLGLIPDYDLVISVMAAGKEVSRNASAMPSIFSSVVKSLVPAIEAAGKDEAASSTGFVGTYSDNSTNSSITLSTRDGPGLLIESFVAHDVDVLGSIGSHNLPASAERSPSEPGHVEGRMYPSGSSTRSGDAKNRTVATAWRAVFDIVGTGDERALDDRLFYQDSGCSPKASIDRASHHWLGLAEFVFAIAEDGAVESVKNPVWGVTLQKVSSGGNGAGSHGAPAPGDDNKSGRSGLRPPAWKASGRDRQRDSIYGDLKTMLVVMAILLCLANLSPRASRREPSKEGMSMV